MKKFTANTLIFPALKGKKISANFNGGSITSDGGVILLREVDRKLDLISSVAACIPDKRDPKKVQHSVVEMLRQRIFALALGYEDLNDQTILRSDDALMVAVEAHKPLASSSTLCRFENNITEKSIWAIHEILVEQFIASYNVPPDEIVLDFDATDDTVHGNQEGRFFHGYYDSYCFLPLYVFAGKMPLVALLRPANQDGAAQAAPILKLLVQRIRQSWPSVKIIVRADSGFCRQLLLNWCDRNGVSYVIGIARNTVLERAIEPVLSRAKEQYQLTQEKRTLFTSFQYKAQSWNYPKRIIGKAEYSSYGKNPRFLVTNLPDDAEHLYRNVYCPRGDMENRIKEQQLCLFADRTSCHNWWPNQFRLILSTLAYLLIERLRTTCLIDTLLSKAQADTIRLKLFKIGALIRRKTRHIVLLFSSSYPYQELFRSVYHKLVPT